ncbi:phospholipase D family protein [Thalassotalea sp. HSM 43]|uniref:phospholipase D family protein n=1 Tax=Thalassotalea sp. HSM 43 TaxID=2552945 RepID=UPI0010803CFE|nr:phospholipase D family protein [Thalassotalea sp. HSM 43]QBY03532.1 phospholipase D family protein [Thalassotalea sp. HSM 43]
MPHKTVPLLILLTVSVLVLFTACSHPGLSSLSVDEDYCALIPPVENDISLSKLLVPDLDQMKNRTGIYVLERGSEAVLTRAWLSDHAEKSIDVQYFIFSADNVGLLATYYLVAAAERGVKVRVIIDDILVDAKAKDLLIVDSHPNIDIKIYNPVANVGKNIVEKFFHVGTNFYNLNQRMHNKSFIVDGRVSITGGRNVANEYYGFDREYNFRDRDVLMIGGQTRSVQNSFEQFWYSPYAVPVSELIHLPNDTDIALNVEALNQYACNPKHFYPSVRQRINLVPTFYQRLKDEKQLLWLDDVEYLSDFPGKNTDTNGWYGSGHTTDKIRKLISAAKHSVVIHTPYLVTKSQTKKLFKELIERGVRVSILTNSLASTDNIEAFSGYHRDRERLIAIGIELYEFRPDANIRRQVMMEEIVAEEKDMPVFGLHAKSIVIDQHIAIIGTHNLDPRSDNLNTEAITIIKSQNIAKKLNSYMVEEMQPENAWRIRADFNPDDESSLFKRLQMRLRKLVPKKIL